MMAELRNKCWEVIARELRDDFCWGGVAGNRCGQTHHHSNTISREGISGGENIAKPLMGQDQLGRRF
tara:strand:+ start:239 stop:439 length:201 start_codon:yes stop_codon:yes gene_type:complete